MNKQIYIFSNFHHIPDNMKKSKLKIKLKVTIKEISQTLQCYYFF